MEVGDLSHLPYSNQEEYTDDVHFAFLVNHTQETLEKIKSFPPETKIYLWVNKACVGQYLNFLFFAKEFKSFPEVYLVSVEDGISKNEFSAQKALTKKKKLSCLAIDRLTKKFQAINSQKETLYVVRNGKILTHSVEKIAKKALELVPQRYTLDRRVEGKYVKKYTNTRYDLSYDQIKKVYSFLYKNGAIEFKNGNNSDIDRIRLKPQPKNKK